MTSHRPTGSGQNSTPPSRTQSLSGTRRPGAPGTPSPTDLGAEGETRAAHYLESRGYRIVARNVRAGGVELDLVARRGRLVVFVEVKTRRTRRFGPPELAVDRAKRQRLVAGAQAWLYEDRRRFARVRFDVIAWQVSAEAPGKPAWALRHIENAFEHGD